MQNYRFASSTLLRAPFVRLAWHFRALFDVSQFRCEGVCSRARVCDYTGCFLHAALCVGQVVRGGARAAVWTGVVRMLPWATV